ncbi:hypothetical protein I8H84_05675 [Candidatus Saccharibacteria bacterium]|nr:hypothetical protein [Candidatus Saccharibacteria bacterium]MBH1973177.1 hypothetical protein [Candidatus Saccharibacteria bacterium]MBH1990582.1 hypothetical protein [Candidatus Saccharibacteria bacterium]
MFARRIISGFFAAQQMKMIELSKQTVDVEALHAQAREEAKQMELISIDPSAPSKVLAEAAMLRVSQLRHAHDTALQALSATQNALLTKRKYYATYGSGASDIKRLEDFIVQQEGKLAQLEPLLTQWGVQTEKLATGLHLVD